MSWRLQVADSAGRRIAQDWRFYFFAFPSSARLL